MTPPKTDLEERIKSAKEAETADHQHQWEAAVLGALVAHVNSDVSEVKWPILERLKSDDFTRSDYRSIFTAIRHLHDASEGVDLSTVKDKLTSMGVEVSTADLDSVFKAHPPDDTTLILTYVKRLADRGQLRRARAFAQSVVAKLEKAQSVCGPEGIYDAIAAIQGILSDMTESMELGRELTHAAAEIDSLMLDLEGRRADDGYLGLNTGFRHLNEVINGLGPGLFIIGAAPSAGKTTFVKQMADNVAKLNAVPVLFFSYEQSNEELHVKTLARLAKVNTRDIVKGRTNKAITLPNGKVEPRPLWDLIKCAANKYKEFGRHISIIEAGHETTIEKIRVLAHAAKQNAKAKKIVIVIDYLQAMPVKSARDFSATKERVDFLCSELRRLARDLNAAIIAISSVNRHSYGNQGKKPRLDAFKESGGIEYGADIGAILHTDEKETERLRQSHEGTQKDHRRAVNLMILKNRNGELANIRMVFYPDIATFAENDKTVRQYHEGLNESSEE